MSRTIIDLREDGPHIRPDPNATMVHYYDPDLLAQLAAAKLPPPSPEDPIYKAGIAAGLGSFFDALVARGLTREEAQELLWSAYEGLRNLKGAA